MFRLSCFITIALVILSTASRADEVAGLVVAVADGDTITVLDNAKAQHRIRLSGIDAPEKRQPFGTVSRQHLADTAADYTRAGLPWFEYFDAERKALEGAVKLAGLDSVAALSIKKGAGVIADNGPIGTPVVKALGPKGMVREGEF